MSDFLGKLQDGGFTLFIIKGGKPIFSSKMEGMGPLLEAINTVEPSKLHGSIVVDKMVGKAAALLICLFKAQEVHTHIMSLRATKVLDKYDVKYAFEKVVPELLNKFGTDICPFEKAIIATDDLEEGFKRLTSEAKRISALKKAIV
ncbi:MAG: hypothetical protein QG670_281 [Thermoproteota archaeon]|nr:hypothetical protein [Thermoproteota archaeon]